MSQAEKANELKIEIQKLLGDINRDMTKLKTEVASLNDILDVDASLPTNQKLVNDRLMVAAKEAGIDLNDLEIERSEEGSEQDATQSQHNSSQEHDSDRGNGTQDSQEDNEQTASPSNAATLAAATNKLTKNVKRTLRKVN